jgi:Ca2+-binding RTX toxin-like protein
MLGLLAAASPAAASTAGLSGSQLQFNAVGGETNNVALSQSGASFVISDPGAPITPLAGCAAAGANQVSCPSAGVQGISLFLGDQNDQLHVADGVIVQGFNGVDAFGGPGNDLLAPGNGSGGTEFFGDAGDDVLQGSADGERLEGGTENDTVNGNGGGDFLSGGDGADSVSGGPGDDGIDEGSSPSGPDVDSGGDGIDRLDYRSRDENVGVSLDGAPGDGAACPGASCEGDNVQADIERLLGGNGDDALTGSAAANELDGEDGNDVLDGAGGPDDLFGGDGADTLAGSAGGDHLTGDAGGDNLQGGGGEDFLEAEALDLAADAYSGGAGEDTVDFVAGSSISIVIYGGVHQALRVSLDGRPDDGVTSTDISGPRDNAMADLENIVGGEGADLLIGNGKANQIEGEDGNDRIVGGKGADGLLGENGRDQLTGGKGRDLLDGAGGADRIKARDRKPDEVLCGSSADKVKGDRADDVAADCEKVRRR